MLNGYFRNTLPIAICIATIISSNAFAEKGGDSGAGGNTINYKLVSKYIIRENDPLLRNLEAYLKNLPHLETTREGTPFVSVVMEKMKNAKIYVVPREIEQLPSEKTGLYLSTEQSAYQIGDEIVISKFALEKMSKEEATELLFQEALEQIVSATDDATRMKKARSVLAVIEKSDGKPSGEALAKALNAVSFQLWTSESELQEAAKMRAAVQEEIFSLGRSLLQANFVKNRACESSLPFVYPVNDYFYTLREKITDLRNQYGKSKNNKIFYFNGISNTEFINKFHQSLEDSQKRSLAMNIVAAIFELKNGKQKESASAIRSYEAEIHSLLGEAKAKELLEYAEKNWVQERWMGKSLDYEKMRRAVCETPVQLRAPRDLDSQQVPHSSEAAP